MCPCSFKEKQMDMNGESTQWEKHAYNYLKASCWWFKGLEERKKKQSSIVIIKQHCIEKGQMFATKKKI